MSVFTNTQGRPASVRALVRLLAAFPEGLTLSQMEAWMTPGHYGGAVIDDDDTRDGRKNTSIANTLGAARSLDLLDEDTTRVRLRPTLVDRVFSDFATLVHERFVTTTQAGDRLLVALYAFIVCRSQREGGVGWLVHIGTKELVDEADKAFKAAGDEYAAITFNKDRMPAWKDWASFLGLGFDGVPGAMDFFLPEARARVGAELRAIGEAHGYGEPLAAVDVITALAHRCPYLDRGIAYRALAKAGGIPEDGTSLSPILSRALRELRDAKGLTLEGGEDTIGALKLVGDAIHKTEPVDKIRIHQLSEPAEHHS